MFSTRYVTCDLCEGREVAQKWTVARSADGVEFRASDCMSNVRADLVAGMYPGMTLDWHDAPCPKCSAEGEYEVEFVSCKIF